MVRLLRFLGAGQENVKRCVETASFEKLAKGKERGEEDSTSFLRKGVPGEWIKIFTGEDRHLFNEEARELLVELGYEKDHG